MVVADARPMGELVESMLRLRGYRSVGIVRASPEAVALARAARPELALVDVVFGSDSRREPAALGTARRLRWACGVPSLLTTTTPEKVRPQFDGCGVLRKPFGVQALASAVDATLWMLREGRLPDRLPQGLQLWPPQGPG